MKRPYKKITSILIAAIIIFSLSGCAGKKSSSQTDNASSYTEEKNTAFLEPGSGIFESKHSLSDIDLSAERSWINEDPEYADLIKELKIKKNGSNFANVYLVGTDEDILCLKAYDELEIDGKTKIGPYTTFEIASVSKTFIATAILQLAEQGKLSLDDKLEKYFPEFENGKDITIYQLLHMQAGLYDYGDCDPEGVAKLFGCGEDHEEIYRTIYSEKLTEEEVLDAIFATELKYEPGTKQEYSNTNYHLLAYIIEQASGMSYEEYLQKNIFDVCGLEHTSAATVGDVTSVPNIQGFYAELVDENGHTVNPGFLKGAGDMHSCAADLLAFDRALMNCKLINEDSLAKMLYMDMGYGCGMVEESPGIYYHTGGIIGYGTINRLMTTKEGQHIYFIQLRHD